MRLSTLYQQLLDDYHMLIYLLNYLKDHHEKGSPLRMKTAFSEKRGEVG